MSEDHNAGDVIDSKRDDDDAPPSSAYGPTMILSIIGYVAAAATIMCMAARGAVLVIQGKDGIPLAMALETATWVTMVVFLVATAVSIISVAVISRREVDDRHGEAGKNATSVLIEALGDTSNGEVATPGGGPGVREPLSRV